MADSITISLLPVSLSIVHIPRSRIHDLFHPLLRQLLLPSPTFLNITCNELELTLFAEHHLLRDFEPIAKKDARRSKVRGRDPPPNSSKSKRHDQHNQRTWCPIELSSEKWNVLQIDSHSDGLSNSGARIHELSAPLAAAGVSILYQSSYMSDFIFVKEHRLAKVMSLLAAAGFDLYSSDPQKLTSQVSAFTSPALSVGDIDEGAPTHFSDVNTPIHVISSENGAVFTRSRSTTNIVSRSSPFRSQVQVLHNDHQGDDDESSDSSEHSPFRKRSDRPPLPRSQSHSPSECDVHILEPDLTSIGLSDDTADVWTTKIIKLFAFPDMIPVPNGHYRTRGRTTSASHSTQSSADCNEAITPLDALGSITGMLGDSIRVFSTHDVESDSNSSRTDDTTRDGLRTPSDPDSRPPPVSPLSDMSTHKTWVDEEYSNSESVDNDGDTYFSPRLDILDNPTHSPRHIENGHPLLKQKPRLPRLNTATPTPYQTSHTTARSRSDSTSSLSESKPDPIIPFFSFTRTPEGSSLTASVPLLAALFPPSERHLVICSGELDFLDSRVGSPERPLDDVDGGDENTDAKRLGTLKCLQIDLRRFGLDKHGLVSRFSRTLEDNGINHMYSSTYKTANLLVDKADAWRAQALLRSC